MKKKENKPKKDTPAIPPEDYSGSIADWHVALISRGLWNGYEPGWNGDVKITEEQWWEILEECEGPEDSDDGSP